MGYSINVVDSFGVPFQRVHEQVVLAPAQGWQTTMNEVRKIIFVLSGECRHRIVGWDGPWADVFLHPGDILALPYGCEQHYYTHEPGHARRLHVVRLSFDPELLPPLPLLNRLQTAISAKEPLLPRETSSDLQALADCSLSHVHFLRGAALDTAIQETLTHLRDESRRRPPQYRLRVHGLCTGLTTLYARKALEGRPPATDTGDPLPAIEYHVGKVKEYLRSRLADPPRLAQIAAHVRLSEEHTVRIFRKATGMTISAYGRRLRIAEAKNLLATTDSNLSEVARRSGFASLTVFSRNFKQEEGVTPSEFRREIARQMG